MDHYRAIELCRDIRFIRRTQVAAPLEVVLQLAFGVAVLQHLHCFVVGDARKRRVDLLQLRDIALDRRQLRFAPLQHALHDKGDEILSELHDVVEFGESHFGFDHPELGEVAAGLRLLRAEGWPEAVHLAERHRGGFNVELAGLRQKRRIAEVIDGKQRGGAFASRRRQDRRLGQGEALVVEEIMRRAHDLAANPQDRRLPLAAYPQMAMLHQELDAVLFRRDRVRLDRPVRPAQLRRSVTSIS